MGPGIDEGQKVVRTGESGTCHSGTLEILLRRFSRKPLLVQITRETMLRHLNGTSRTVRRWCPVSRGRRPKIAIEEAERHAAALGYEVLVPNIEGALYDFMAVRQGQPTFVRVRRIKYHRYSVAEIEHSCGREIACLRSIIFSGDASRELWVRGSSRNHHRYLVLPDRVEALEKERTGSSGQQVRVG
jgi:hypothetical protein